MDEKVKVIETSDGNTIEVIRYVSFGYDDTAIAVCASGSYLKRANGIYELIAGKNQ